MWTSLLFLPITFLHVSVICSVKTHPLATRLHLYSPRLTHNLLSKFATKPSLRQLLSATPGLYGTGGSSYYIYPWKKPTR